MKEVGLIVLLLLFLTPHGLSDAEFHRSSLNERIAALFGKPNIFNIQRCLSNSISHPSSKSATLTTLEAKAHPEYLTPENRFILQRPTDSDDADYYGSGIAVVTYDTPEGNFKIHYAEDNANGDAVYGYDGDAATIPQFVIDAGSAFENVRSHILSLGYPNLRGDGDKGGDSRFDVYILDLPASYGYTSFDDNPSEAYIVVDNDFASVLENLDPEGDQAGAIKVTAAHELFHAFQFQYSTDIADNGWWMEASSTWMEDELFPEVKDYLNYLGLRYDDRNENGKWDEGETYYNIDGSVAGTTGRVSKWFDEPEEPLDTNEGSYEYGSVIWAKYLSENYGKGMIRDIWMRIGDGQKVMDAILDECAALQLSFSSLMKDFRKRVLLRDFVDGRYYPMVKHEGSYGLYPISVSGRLDHLSSRYYALKANGSEGSLVVELLNMNEGDLAVRLILNRTDGGYEEQDVALDSPDVTAKIPKFGASAKYSKVTLTLMNNSLTQDSRSFSFNAMTEAADKCSNNQSEEGRCFIATAAYGSYLDPHVKVLRDFRDKHLLTNPVGTRVVACYYEISPAAAAYIRKHETLKAFVRFTLTPIVSAIQFPIIIHLLVIAVMIALIFRRGKTF